MVKPLWQPEITSLLPRDRLSWECCLGQKGHATRIMAPLICITFATPRCHVIAISLVFETQYLDLSPGLGVGLIDISLME